MALYGMSTVIQNWERGMMLGYQATVCFFMLI